LTRDNMPTSVVQPLTPISLGFSLARSPLRWFFEEFVKTPRHGNE
jgi:hypothetical protein